MELARAFSTMAADLPAIFSMIVVSVVGLVMLTVAAFRSDHPSIPWLGVAGMVVASAWELFQLGTEPGTAFFGAIRVGGYAAFINLLVLLAGIATTILSVPYLHRLKHDYGEVYALLMYATVGTEVATGGGTTNRHISGVDTGRFDGWDGLIGGRSVA